MIDCIYRYQWYVPKLCNNKKQDRQQIKQANDPSLRWGHPIVLAEIHINHDEKHTAKQDQKDLIHH